MKKVFAVQTAYLSILFLTLYVSLQADYTCLQEIFPAEIHFFLRFSATLLGTVAAWRFLYYDAGRGYSLRNILVCLLFIAGSVVCFLVLQGTLSLYDFSSVICFWSGSTLGSLEKKFGPMMDDSFFPWIAPLPFCLYVVSVKFSPGWDLFLSTILLGCFCIVIYLFWIVPCRFRLVKLLILSGTICILCSMVLFTVRENRPGPGYPVSGKTEKVKNDPLFPLLILSLLHSETEQQDVLILSGQPLNPERAKILSSMKWIRKIRTISPLDFKKNSADQKNSFHVILYDVNKADTLQKTMFYTPEFFLDLKKKLLPGGILGLNLSFLDKMPGMEEYFFDTVLFQILGKSFPQALIFSSQRYILCFNTWKNQITDPEILEYRADKKGEAREYFPRGVFQLLLSDQRKIDFTDRDGRALPDPVELSLSSQRVGRLFLREKAVLQNELRSMPYLSWIITLGGLFIYILYRYLCAIPEKHKKFLSFDCGFLTGGLLMILTVFLPLKWGYSSSYFSTSFLVLFVCSFYCGMFTAWKMRRIPKWWDLFFSLLACLPLSLFFVLFQENLCNGLFGGVSGGLACGFFVRKYALWRREYFLGLGSALLLGTIGIFLSCVWQYVLLVAASALEYVKKIFEKN